MRWWKKLLLVLALIITGVVITTYYYLFHAHGLERIVSDQLTKLIGRSYPLTVTVGSIRGNPLSGLVVEDVLVGYRDAIGSFPICRAKRLTATYAMSNLWHANYVFNYIGLDSLALTLVADSSGRWRLPQPPASRDSGGAPAAFRVDQLALNAAALQVVRQTDTIAISDINLAAAFQSEGGTLSLDLKYLSLNTNREGIGVANAAGRVTYSDGQILIQNLFASVSDTRVKLSGLVRLPERIGQVDFDANGLNLDELSRYIGVSLNGNIDANGHINLNGSQIDGTVDLAGKFLFAGLENLHVGFHFQNPVLTLDTLYGLVFDRCAIDGRGKVNFARPMEKYELFASIRNFSLNSLIEKSFPSNLNGTVAMRGQSFANDKLRLDMSVNLFESSFDDYPFQSAAGDISVTTDSITFADGFSLSYYENTFSISGRVGYSDTMALNVKAQLNNLDRWRRKLFIDQPGGRAAAEALVSGNTSDPDLNGTLTSDSLWLYQIFSRKSDVNFNIKRFLTRQQGEVTMHLANGSMWAKPYDSAYTHLRLDSGVATIDTVFLRNEQAIVTSRGVLDYGIYPRELRLDTLRIGVLNHTLTNSGPIHVNIDTLGFDFTQLGISGVGAIARGKGRVNFDESMSLSLSTDHVPVQTWVEIVKEEFPIDGYARVAIDVAGTFASPRITLVGAIDSLSYRELDLGDLKISAKYADEVATIDSLSITSDKGLYRASGRFGIDLAFNSDSLGRLVDKPIDLNLSGTDHRFDLVSLLLPSVEQLDGDFFADIRLFGTPSRPQLEGEAYLKNARLKYYDLADTLYSDSAGVTMKQDTIVIENIQAYVKDPHHAGRKSYANVEGSITVETLDRLYYSLDVSLPREFPFTYDLDDINGVVEGTLHVEGDSPPTVTGDLTVLSMQYRANFATADQGSPLMELLVSEESWNLNINVEILSNYWIKNQDIDAEFSGSMNVIREKGSYRFVGEMDVLRGKGFLFDKTFQLDAGSRVVFDNINYLNPTLDITCYTRIPGLVRPNDPSREPIDLRLHITGTLEVPELNTASDSPYPKEDILPLIVANYAANDTAGVRAPGQVEQRLTGLVSSQVSQLGSRQLSRLGVETFEIDPVYNQGQLDPLKSQVTLGFYTAPGLYMYGRSALSGRLGQEVGFEYRLNKEVRVEGHRDELQLYHLNLKLHWEF